MDDRKELLRKYIDKELLGLEIGPLTSGICRKSENFNILILDVFDKNQILTNYKEDNNQKNRLHLVEDVDIVSTKNLEDALDDYSKLKKKKTKT